MIIKISERLILLIAVSVFIACQSPTDTSTENIQVLWYEQAATVWEEALPLGNGRLGAMVFGDPTSERIQLNDDSLWPKDLNWDHPPGTPKDLAEIRQLLFEGAIQTVDSLLVEKFSRKQSFGHIKP